MTTTIQDWRDDTSVGTYHDVMRHEFRDRGGFEPTLVGHNQESDTRVAAGLEAEHDWVLLVFAGSARLRELAATCALPRSNSTQVVPRSS